MNAVAAAELFALANERSSEKRLELLRRITDDLMQHSDEATAASQYLIDEIVGHLVNRLAGEDRVSAAQSLAHAKRMPDHVARQLASDKDIKVAGPVLESYEGLSDQILSAIAAEESQEHLLAIAARRTLAPAVADIVVDRGNENVVNRLAANNGARFSRFGLRTLVSKAERNERLRELIVDRCDLTLDAIGQLLPLISQELSARLNLPNVDLGSAVVVQEQVVSWMSARKKHIDQVNLYAEQVKRGSRKLDDVVAELSIGQRLLDVSTVIAAVSELDRSYAYNLLTQGHTEPVTIMLRALGMGWPAAEMFLKLRVEKLGQSLCGPMIAREDYEAVDEAGAQRVIRFLKVRRVAMANSPKSAQSAA